ncbi:MAG TPA: ATP-binding protein, partial [Allocoleopsis sp.]
ESAGNSFNSLQEAIFKQAWEGKTYEVIAEQLGYSESHIKETGNELWKRLTEALSEKVTKKNFRAALERKQRSLQQQSDSANPQAANFPASVAITPHVAAPTTYTDPNFVGREEAIAQITSLASQGAKIITICAPGGVGKTTLAWQYLHTHGFDTILEIWMAKEIQSINSVESEVERWIQQNFGEEPGRDFGVNLERLRQKLRAPNQRIGILIDNLEPALDKNGRFIENRRPYVDLLRVLADPGARSLTLITSRERLCEPSVEIRDYRLEGLDETTWQEFFSSRDIKTNTSALKEMHHAYGGNAKAMQILSSAIQIDFDGNLENFWQLNQANLLLNPTLENLVSEQFNRLQEIYPETYKLLYRLGCFRYQDIPTISIDAVIHLLWDIEESQKKRVLQDLQSRALIETKNYEYWLHPVIRSEAIRRLRTKEEWMEVNCRASNFWTKSIFSVEST